jgi:hypothetical protein
MSRGRLKVAIPDPHGSVVSVGLLRRILRQAGISTEDWEAAK